MLSIGFIRYKLNCLDNDIKMHSKHSGYSNEHVKHLKSLRAAYTKELIKAFKRENPVGYIPGFYGAHVSSNPW